MGWTKKSVAATLLQVTEEQRREMAARLAQRMDERSLTNDLLAHEAGVSSKTISRILNAHHDPRIATIEKVASAVGFTREEFRGLTETPDLLGTFDGTEKVSQRLARIEKALSDALDEVREIRLVAEVGQLASADTKQTGQPSRPAGRKKAA